MDFIKYFYLFIFHSANIDGSTITITQNDICGVLHSSKLFNNLSILDEFPWVVSIMYEWRDGMGKVNCFYCLGSIISERFVLTSGFCVDLDWQQEISLSVRLGKYNIYDKGVECVKNLRNTDCSPSTQDVPVEKIITHPDYNPENLHHDLALIKFNKDIVYTDYIRPLCLQNLDGTINYSLDDYWISGYSKQETNIVKKRNNQLISAEECSKKLSLYFGRSYNLTESSFCTLDGLKGPYTLDYGSPLMFPRGERWYQEGIVSFRTNCTLGAITIYTALSNYIQWILQNITK